MIWVNGSIVDGKLSPSISNDSGSWLYEVMRVQDGCPVFLTEHLNRMQSGISRSKGTANFSQDELTTGIFSLISKETITIGNIRIQLNLHSGDILIGKIPHHYPTRNQISGGINVGILEKERSQPNIKSWNPEVRFSADNKIQDEDVYEVLLVNSKGQVTEGSRSNIFGIKNGQVITPPLHQILPGITREIIFDLCHENGIIIAEKVIMLNQLNDFSALFISGTSPGVLPVKNIRGLEFNPSHPVIEKIKFSYSKRVEQNIERSVKMQARDNKYGK